MSISVIEDVPSAEEYVSLRIKAGLWPKQLEAAKKGLANSLYAVTIREKEKLVAMGRVIGDGGCFFEIVDIAVDPKCQGQGLGKKVMMYIEKYISENAHTDSYVSMIANTPLFYEKFGYRCVMPTMQGMGKRL